MAERSQAGEGLDRLAMSDGSQQPRPARPRWRRYIGPRRAFVALVAAILLAVAWYVRSHNLIDPNDVVRMVEAAPTTMILGFVLLFAVGVLTAVPTLPLNLAAGFLWGPILGGILSTAGATIGGTVAFLVARSLMGPVLARRFDNRIVTAVQRELRVNGWRFLAFVRLNPIFPTGPLNYALGLTGLSLRTYVCSTFCFLLIPSWVFGLIGHQLGSFVTDGEAGDMIRTFLIICGAVGLLVGIRYAAVIMRDSHVTADDQTE